MKSLTVIFYGTDGQAAKDAANQIRKDGGSAILRHAQEFRGEDEPCERVLALPCVAAHELKRLEAVFGDRLVSLKAADVVPPPPPPLLPPDPLKTLPADWRTNDDVDVRKIAAAVSGRTVENRDQAVAVIEEKLAIQ